MRVLTFWVLMGFTSTLKAFLIPLSLTLSTPEPASLVSIVNVLGCPTNPSSSPGPYALHLLASAPGNILIRNGLLGTCSPLHLTDMRYFPGLMGSSWISYSPDFEPLAVNTLACAPFGPMAVTLRVPFPALRPSTENSMGSPIFAKKLGSRAVPVMMQL